MTETRKISWPEALAIQEKCNYILYGQGRIRPKTYLTWMHERSCAAADSVTASEMASYGWQLTAYLRMLGFDTARSRQFRCVPDSVEQCLAEIAVWAEEREREDGVAPPPDLTAVMAYKRARMMADWTEFKPSVLAAISNAEALLGPVSGDAPPQDSDAANEADEDDAAECDLCEEDGACPDCQGAESFPAASKDEADKPCKSCDGTGQCECSRD